ncbi:MAG: EAL domain-containing protein [Lachnospiraceae bacterium]|nr:EAL domain-containing protein [Lachnospiraceae bacterium]
MKTYNHLFESLDNFNDFLDGIIFDRSKQVLLRIHSNIHTADMMEELAANLKELLPNAVMIGCSASHVICEGKILQGVCLLSLTVFENCEIRIGMFSCEQEPGVEKSGEVLGEEVSNALVKGDKGMLLTFFPLSYYKTAKFVEHMDRLNKGLHMIGGVAYVAEGAHSEAGERAYVLGQTEASVNKMAAVMLVSSKLFIYENVICGAEGVGRSYEVTKVHDHFVDEIEGDEAAKWYQGILGREELEKDPTLASLFPLVLEETQTAYNVVYELADTLPEPYKSEKRDRINVFSEISEGMKFGLGYFAPQRIVDQLSSAYEELGEAPVETLFAYECLSRMWMLHDCASWEIGQFYTTNISGAIMAGEIGNLKGKNLYGNATFMIAGLSENENARLILKEKGLKNVSGLQHENMQIINYLLMTGNRQLSKQLSLQRDKMKQAMFYQEVLGLDNQAKYIYDKDTLHLDKLAVFSLKNEKMIRLFLGQEVFWSELKTIYESLKEHLTEKEPSWVNTLHFYSYGENGLLIAAEESLKDDGKFVECIKAVYDFLNGIVCRDFTLSYECAIVMYEEDALQKADTALQYGIRNKNPFVIYNQLQSEVTDMKEKLRILRVVKESLTQDGIVPYFQGIYDNRKGRIEMYEALIRIKDTQGNLYYPGQFLPIAKEYDLYGALSVNMVKTVMSMFLHKDVKVTINLNVQDIYDGDMIEMIFHYLEQADYPENFVFELVESEEVKDYQYVEQFAESIHDHGAKIAIDDFGSGFSNLLHIIKINADILKIDGEIIKVICQDENCREFVSMINGWCKNKGKEVIGEFVENENIQQIMEKIGIAYSQGYYFAKPERWEDIAEKISCV